MPSTLVHVGFAALLATALLSDHFAPRTLAVVLAAAAVPDLDTLVGLWVIDGGHRTVFHNLVLPMGLLLLIGWDVRWRNQSWIRTRWGDAGVRTAWVSVLGGWIAAQALLDAFFNGANLFWPLYDQFIDLSGYVYFSDQRGVIQTILEVERTADGFGIVAEHTRGGRRDTHYYTGVDPGRDAAPGTERLFPIADRGTFLVVMLAGYLAAGFRFWERRRRILVGHGDADGR